MDRSFFVFYTTPDGRTHERLIPARRLCSFLKGLTDRRCTINYIR